MRISIFISLFMIIGLKSIAQNIGIGVDQPQYKLDLLGKLAIRPSAPNYAGILFDSPLVPAKYFFGMMDDNSLGIKSNTTNNWPFRIDLAGGFVGIGNMNPTMNLDIKGRPRIRYNGTNTPGIWFDGPTVAQAAFIGNYDNNYVGLYANGLWNMVMNVNNGNVGVSTTSPTSRLDVNGNIRMRSSGAQTGSYVVSSDTEGNAEWATTVAFKAVGCYNGIPFEVSAWNNPSKIYFHQTPEYNVGNAYHAGNAEFTAPVDGIYHFEAVLDWQDYNRESAVILKRERSGVVNSVGAGSIFYLRMISPPYNEAETLQPSVYVGDVKLLAGDKIWIEVDFSIWSSGYINYISPNTFKTYFTGHLVSRI